jgi:acyl-CoA carboxylase epsilon subunit-like protein
MAERPDLRVVRGTPTAEELAAIVGVLWSRAAAVVAAPPPLAASRWRASALPHPRGLPRPGRGAWSASAR